METINDMKNSENTAIGALQTSMKTRKENICGKVLSFFEKFWLPTLLLLPGIVLLFTFFIYPAFNMFFNSFRDINILKGTSVFVGFKKYASIFSDSVFIKSLRNTVIYVVSVTAIVVPLSFIVSLLVDGSAKMGAFMRGVLYLPSIIAMSIVALMWKLILASRIGIISRIVEGLGFAAPNFFADIRYALMTVVGIGIWRSLGANTILFIAGLRSMAKDQLEAADVDGATPLQCIIHIVIPNIKYVIAFVTITTIIGCFQVFTMIQVLTLGGPNNATNMLAFQIRQEGFRFFDLGKANAISALVFVVLLLLAMIMIHVLTRREDA